MVVGWNSYLALLGENLFMLSLVHAVLSQLFAARPDLLDHRVIAGTGFTAIAGLLLMSWLARSLPGEKQRTGLPVAPSRIVFVMLLVGVIDPTFRQARMEGWTGEWAVWTAWQVATVAVSLYGLGQILWGLFGPWLRFERTASLGIVGAVASVALVLGPLSTVMEQPYIAFPVAAVLLLQFSTRLPLPFGLPPAFLALGLGSVISILSHQVIWEDLLWQGPLLPSLQGWGSLRGWSWLLEHPTLFLPLLAGLLQGLVMEVSLVESAIAFEDDYPLRPVLVSLGLCNLVGGWFGACVPCTLVVGHAAYQKFESGTSYLRWAGITLLVFMLSGLWRPLIVLIPEAAWAPLWILVLLTVVSAHLERASRGHPMVYVLAMVPVFASLLVTPIESLISPSFLSLTPALLKSLSDQPGGHWVGQSALGSGTIVTGLLWGSMAANWMDGRLGRASLFAFLACALTAVGVMHARALDFSFGPLSAGYLILGIALHIAYVHELERHRLEVLNRPAAPPPPLPPLEDLLDDSTGNPDTSPSDTPAGSSDSEAGSPAPSE